MGMKFTKVPVDTFETIQINAGIVCKGFNPATLDVTTILSATSGGIQFASNPTYTDYFEDVDNVPNNTKQGKKLLYFDPVLSGTMLSVNAENVRQRLGAADVSTTSGVDKITPRGYLVDSDFEDIWFVGDYSDQNTGATAGFIAIHIFNALNTTGFQLQTGKNAKGQSTFEFHGHYDIEDEDQEPPFEIYVKAGTSGNADPAVKLDKHVLRIVGLNNTATLNASTTPAGATVTWASASTSVATVSGGVVTGKTAGNTIITASITDSGVTYNDTCTVIVTAS